MIPDNCILKTPNYRSLPVCLGHQRRCTVRRLSNVLSKSMTLVGSLLKPFPQSRIWRLGPVLNHLSHASSILDYNRDQGNANYCCLCKSWNGLELQFIFTSYEAFSFVMIPINTWAPKRKSPTVPLFSAHCSLLRQPLK